VRHVIVEPVIEQLTPSGRPTGRPPGRSRRIAVARPRTRAGEAAAVAGSGAEDADADGTLGPRTVAALTEAGFPRHFVPRRWGGRAGGFAELFAAVAEVGEHCASAAWCAALWAAHGRYAARLPEAARRELWEASPDVRISAAVVPPAGLARPVHGGWSLRGRWSFASGVEHADWVLLAARVEDDAADEGVCVCVVPRAQLTIDATWDAVGLRGTGSHSVSAEALFVPGRRSMSFGRMTCARTASGSTRRSALDAPAQLAGGLLMAAPALGAARAALAEWTRTAAAEPRGAAPLDRSASAQHVLARSTAQIEAAGLLLTRAARRADSGPADAAAVAANMRDAAFAADSLVEAVERLLRTGGAATRGRGGVLQRAWRDVHTLAAHGALRWEVAEAAYARSVQAEPIR